MTDKKLDVLGAILSIVSMASGNTVSNVRGKNRERPIAIARHMFRYYANKYTGYSLTSISTYIGGSGHANVIHSVKEVHKILKAKEQPYYEWTVRVEELLKVELIEYTRFYHRAIQIVEANKHITKPLTFYTNVVEELTRDIHYILATNAINDEDRAKTLKNLESSSNFYEFIKK